MSYRHVLHRQRNQLTIEALTFGLAYGAGLCWATTCLMANFRPNGLRAPYWNEIPSLRTDTTGVLAFFALATLLACSEFLRLRRRWGGYPTPNRLVFEGSANAAALAIGETVCLLATGLIIYISVNTVTHPKTLTMQATHLVSWPTEGTLRVIALLLGACSAAMLRFLRAECKAWHERVCG
jgi:hypothetical protein